MKDEEEGRNRNMGSASSSARKLNFDNQGDEEKEMILLHAQRCEYQEKILSLEDDRMSVERRLVEWEGENYSHL